MPNSPETLFHPTTDLTANQARLLKYIVDNPREVMFLTTAKLAAESGVSEATVVRLAQVLGYSGYKEMKQDLSRFMMNRMDTVERFKSSAHGIHSVNDLMAAVLQQDLKNLSSLAQQADWAVLHQVVQVLHKAPVIYLVGLRSAYSLAVFLKSGLTLLGKQVYLLMPDTWELWRDVSQAGSGDIVFAFSFPRYTRLTVEVVEAVQQSGATVISLTDSPMSPLARYSDYLLCAPCRIDSIIESYVPALSLLNALITGVGFLQGPETIAHLQKMEKVWEQKQIYHQVESRSLPSWADTSQRKPQKNIQTGGKS